MSKCSFAVSSGTTAYELIKFKKRLFVSLFLTIKLLQKSLTK